MIDVYCVWAYRYADKNAYNFPVGVFASLGEAEIAAKKHRLFRGGKYDHLIYELPIGSAFDAEDLKPIKGFISTWKEEP